MPDLGKSLNGKQLARPFYSSSRLITTLASFSNEALMYLNAIMRLHCAICSTIELKDTTIVIPLGWDNTTISMILYNIF
ncbi:hypothetical protein AZE42_12517 [Rhizopogon vesiculosus]|uniref:Uncharacterized protein n=1 Tax=Rhizopogon vesiculosus TaxID=180088 RepID=A0A1J8PM66_9AGAM|nr:hypothetical protein AZE42_12517 [Rhizopogon vesiculosus]